MIFVALRVKTMDSGLVERNPSLTDPRECSLCAQLHMGAVFQFSYPFQLKVGQFGKRRPLIPEAPLLEIPDPLMRIIVLLISFFYTTSPFQYQHLILFLELDRLNCFWTVRCECGVAPMVE